MTGDDIKGRIKDALSDPRDVARRLSLDTHGEGRREERGAGGAIKVCCPWHREKHPSCSLTVGPDRTLRAHCFTCGEGGDIFSLLAAVRGLDAPRDFRRVLEVGAQLAGLDLDAAERDARTVDAAERRAAEERRREAERWADPLPYGPRDHAFAAVARVVLHLGSLDGGPLSRDVCTYLDGRGLLALARAEGWSALPPAGSDAARSWARVLRANAGELAGLVMDGAGVSRGRAARLVAGELRAVLARDRSVPGPRRPFAFEAPGHRLVIPFRDVEGRLYTWQRRWTGERPRDDKYRFPRGAERGARWPYGVDRLAAAPSDAPVVFVEGATDAVALRALEAVPGCVVLGIAGGAWRASFALLARGRVAYVASDNDSPDRRGVRAGERFAARWTVDLIDAGALAPIKRLAPPDGAKDWTDYLTRPAT